MTTYVLISGACHGAWCFDDLAAGLRATPHAIHDPIGPAAPGQPARPGTPRLWFINQPITIHRPAANPDDLLRILLDARTR
jgi:hypothetical protein